MGRSVGGPHVVDGLSDGPERWHGDQFDLHEPAGGVLGKLQAALNREPVGDRDLGENLCLLLGLQAFQQIDRVVGFKLGDGLCDRVRWQDIEHFVQDLLIQLGQRCVVDVPVEKLDELLAVVRPHQLHEVGKVGFVKPLGQELQSVGLVGLDRGFHSRHEVRRQNAVLVMDFKLFGSLGHTHPVLHFAPAPGRPTMRPAPHLKIDFL